MIVVHGETLWSPAPQLMDDDDDDGHLETHIASYRVACLLKWFISYPSVIIFARNIFFLFPASWNVNIFYLNINLTF